MTNLHWKTYEPETITRINANTYVLRLAKTVSDLEPTITKVFGDRLLVVNGHYNKRGYCVGYSLHFEGEPKILVSDFYLVLDYVDKEKDPKNPVFPELAKPDPKICLVKFGDYLENRMYSFIYRKKRNG
jgi:hypothetical protein